MSALALNQNTQIETYQEQPLNLGSWFKRGIYKVNSTLFQKSLVPEFLMASSSALVVQTPTEEDIDRQVIIDQQWHNLIIELYKQSEKNSFQLGWCFHRFIIKVRQELAQEDQNKYNFYKLCLDRLEALCREKSGSLTNKYVLGASLNLIFYSSRKYRGQLPNLITKFFDYYNRISRANQPAMRQRFNNLTQIRTNRVVGL